MIIKYSVTFEFAERAPVTHTGTIAASRLHTVASRAMKEAQKALRPVNWTSAVFVALERIDDADDGLDHPDPRDVAILGGDPSL